MQNLETNIVNISGEVLSDPVFNHECFSEKFYSSEIKADRLSDDSDTIPIIISERLSGIKDIKKGNMVRISGQFRAYNPKDSSDKKSKLHVFCRNIELLPEGTETENEAVLIGEITKKPVFRITPKGRKISSIFLKVSRNYAKYDYIHCVFWSRNAEYISSLEIGTHIKVKGRIQSREDNKRISETEIEKRMVCEVSVSSMEVLENEESNA